LLFDARFAGLCPADSDGFLKVIKSVARLFFGGEAKPPAPCSKILRHIKERSRYEQRYLYTKFMDIPYQVSPHFAARCLLQPDHATLVDESGIIRTQMGSRTDQKMVAVTWDSLYSTTL
jgi:hypothetical protein